MSAVTARPFTHRLSLRDARRPGPRSTVEPEPEPRHKNKVQAKRGGDRRAATHDAWPQRRNVTATRQHVWVWLAVGAVVFFSCVLLDSFHSLLHSKATEVGETTNATNNSRSRIGASFSLRNAKAPSIIPHPFVEVAAAPRGTELPWSCAALVPR